MNADLSACMSALRVRPPDAPAGSQPSSSVQMINPPYPLAFEKAPLAAMEVSSSYGMYCVVEPQCASLTAVPKVRYGSAAVASRWRLEAALLSNVPPAAK